MRQLDQIKAVRSNQHGKLLMKIEDERLWLPHTDKVNQP